MTHVSKSALFAAATWTALLAPVAVAQNYPSKPVRVLVGFAPGSSTDVAMRLIGPRLGEILGQNVLVDNRAGAGGNIAAEMTAKAAADGYTLLFANGGIAIAQSYYTKLEYSALKDLAPVALVTSMPHIVCSNLAFPAKTIKELVALAKYTCSDKVGDARAYTHARYCLIDALGCAFEALGAPDCTKLLGPIVPGTVVPDGARVPGTSFVLDPIKAAFDTTCLVRWLDFSDTWWAGGHPSDNLGGILAVADYLSRKQLAAGKAALKMRDVMTAMIKAYEIQGVLAESNHFDRPATALDSTILVKIASTAVITRLMGGNVDDVTNALSNAFVDGHPLNIYRITQVEPIGDWKDPDSEIKN
jgi:hypothetical protein